MATRPARVEHGAVFTRRWVVDLMLDIAGYTSDRHLVAERVVEPSVGDGAFFGPLVERIIVARGDVPWAELGDCLRGWDLQADKVEVCQKLVIKLLTDAGCPVAAAEELASDWLHVGDFLLSDRRGYRATLVIGNPPYIRIEDVPPQLLAGYRAACPTMGGRADIFVGFYEHGLDLLEPDGKLVYICADRWMRNDYGQALRAKVVAGFAVDTVLVLHDVNAFETEVSAYPAITVLRRGEQGEAVTVDTTAGFTEIQAADFLGWLRSAGATTKTPTWDAARMHSWFETDDIWPTGSAETLAWLEGIQDNFGPLEMADGKTFLKIGVATGNDAVFVVQGESPDVEWDRLVPIVMNKDVRSGEFCWGGRYLLDPWQRTGVLIDLDDYPMTAAYLRQHQAALSKRHTAKAGKWWKTIDAVHHNRLKLPYLVLEDMKGHAHPVLIPAGFYPHHNLYAIYSTAWDLEVLGGILMSEVFERQVAAYCVKMRGGTLRFQAQYIRKCRFPAPGTVPAEIAAELAKAFRTRDRSRATAAALCAYGMVRLPD